MSAGVQFEQVVILKLKCCNWVWNIETRKATEQWFLVCQFYAQKPTLFHLYAIIKSCNRMSGIQEDIRQLYMLFMSQVMLLF